MLAGLLSPDPQWLTEQYDGGRRGWMRYRWGHVYVSESGTTLHYAWLGHLLALVTLVTLPFSLIGWGGYLVLRVIGRRRR